MNVVVEITLGAVVGVLGTWIMDLLGLSILKRKLINFEGLQIVPLLLGRWIVSAVKGGKWIVADVRSLPVVHRERQIGMFAHYLIGAVLGAGFIFVSGSFDVLNLDFIGGGMIYGLMTNIFPWLVMYPAMGFGFFGRKLAVTRQLLTFSLFNHFVYGSAMGLFMGLLLSLSEKIK